MLQHHRGDARQGDSRCSSTRKTGRDARYLARIHELQHASRLTGQQTPGTPSQIRVKLAGQLHEGLQVEVGRHDALQRLQECVCGVDHRWCPSAV